MSEREFLLQAITLGVLVTFLYDGLRIIRKVIPTNSIFVSLEDLFFWIYTTWKVFCLMHEKGDGTLRWFAVIGALSGMWVYRLTLSGPYVKYVSLLFINLFRLLRKLLTYFQNVFTIKNHKG